MSAGPSNLCHPYRAASDRNLRLANGLLDYVSACDTVMLEQVDGLALLLAEDRDRTFTTPTAFFPLD